MIKNEDDLSFVYGIYLQILQQIKEQGKGKELEKICTDLRYLTAEYMRDNKYSINYLPVIYGILLNDAVGFCLENKVIGKKQKDEDK